MFNFAAICKLLGVFVIISHDCITTKTFILMKHFTLKKSLLCISLACAANAMAYDHIWDGIFYEDNGEMYVKIVANPTDEKYSGEITIPQFFNETTYDAEGKAIVNSYFVNAIADGAFEDCVDLKRINLPEICTTIGANAFKGCTSLRDFEFSNSSFTGLVIGDNAFEGCSYMDKITFGRFIDSIGSKAFSGCTELKSVTIKATEVPEIGADVFDAATIADATLTVPQVAYADYKAATGWKDFGTIEYIKRYSFESKGIYYVVDELNSKKAKVTYDYEGCYSGDIVIPEFVQDGYSVYTVAEIGRDAFRGCSELTSITFQGTITNIGINAFEGCSKLQSIDLPAITSLGDEIFRNCTSLKEIVLPETCGRLAIGVFQGCSSLEKITMSDDVYLIGARCFEGCSSLKEFTFPSACYLLGIYAFQNCMSLTEITIPTGITSLNEKAFAGCTNLTKVICEATTPPSTWAEDMFSDYTYENATLVVPDEAIDAYKAETKVSASGKENPNYFSKFKHIAGMAGISNVATSANDNVEIYDLAGVKVFSGAESAAKLPRGIYLVRSAKGVKKTVF